MFNIYTSDWTEFDGTDPFSYVDDVIISCESDSPVGAVEQLQATSDKLEHWTPANRMRIQPDKVCWRFVTLRRVDLRLLSLTYAGQIIRQEAGVIYLGQVIDCRLTMVKHVSNNLNKGKKALGLIRYAAGPNIKLRSLISLERATVLSRLEYGGHICCPISDAQFGRMNKILNQALRIVSVATSKTSGEAYSVLSWLSQHEGSA